MSNVAFSIGHSTRSFQEFVSLLQFNQINLLVDIRSFPYSRYVPQFNTDKMNRLLDKAGIDYVHLPELGGRRSVDKKSKLNMGWKKSGFRAYADYMQTKEFRLGLEKFISFLSKKKAHVAFMCAEAVPWRCHRSLVSDALLVGGFRVKHLGVGSKPYYHTMTKFAKVRNDRITYPGTGKVVLARK